MFRSRPALAMLASLTLVLAVLSTAAAVNDAAAGPVGIAADPVALAADPVAHVVLSEVMTGGSSASDELIELYNPALSALPLEGLEVVYVTATGGTITRKASWAAGAAPLPPGAHLLIANGAGAFAGIADLSYTNGLAATGGSVAIRIIGASTAIDAVGWGSAASAWMEGSPAATPAAGASLERLPGGSAGSGQDTDQNSVDFVERSSPDPQNSASPPIQVATPAPTASTTTSESPAETPSVTPAPTTGAPSDTPSASTSATPTATAATTATVAATPTLTATPAPPAATPTPPSPTLAATPTPPGPTPPQPPISIAAARAMADGTSVTVEGVSLTDSAFSDGGGYLADATAGIAVLLGDGMFPRGVTLRVRGELDQRFSQRTLRASGADVTVVGAATEPAPSATTTGAINEAHEGQLVELGGVVVSGQTILSSGVAVDLDDGSGLVRVMVGAVTGIDAGGWVRNAHLRLRGVVGQRDSSGSGTAGYRVQPRDAADIVAISPPIGPTPSPSTAQSGTPVPSAGASVISIAAARASGVNTRLTVRGVITLASGLAEPGEAAIQDASGAILLRLGDEAGRLALGELVEVAGTRSTRSGMETIRVTAPPRKLGTQALPDPLRRATGALGEAQEAMLVIARGEVALTPRRTSAQNVYFDIDDGSGPVRVFIGPAAGIQTDAILIGEVLEVAGVLGQETTGKLTDRGYRLWPRRAGDLRVVTAAPGATPGGSTAGGGTAGQPGGPGSATGPGASTAGQPGSLGAPAKPVRQQGVPRLEAPAPTASISSLIPNSSPSTALPKGPADQGATPLAASAALLVLAGLLLGGGGVATGPPGLATRVLAHLRQRLSGDGDAEQGAEAGVGGGAVGAPRLVPLTVLEDAHERAGRILPPT